MKLISLLAILLLTACGKPQTAELKLNAANIFGGNRIAEDSKFLPFIVGVFDPINNYICTGTIIAHNTVLTAAHCVHKAKEQKINIVFDTKITSNNILKATKIIVHPEFVMNDEVIKNDLALVQFEGSLPENKKIIEVNSINDLSSEITSDVHIAGMGHNIIKPFKMGAGTLRESVLSNQTFNLDYDVFKLDQSKDTGVCQGDSGSGVFTIMNDQIYLVGVTSAVDTAKNKKKADCNKNSYFSSVKYFLNWIELNK